jgi:hypothetical protein
MDAKYAAWESQRGENSTEPEGIGKGKEIG